MPANKTYNHPLVSHINTAIAVVVLTLVPHVLNAQQPSFAGSTGNLTTPDALIATQGFFDYQYNNFIEDRFLNDHKKGSNHVFTIGIYPRFEIGGRLTDFTPIGEQLRDDGVVRGLRDLSGNAKLNLINHHNKLWISVGAIDFGGLAKNFGAVYLVTTARWKGFHGSVGVATGDNPSFNGAYSNLRLTINRHISLMAEVDTTGSTSAGVTGSLSLGKKFRLGTTISTGEDNARLGLNVSYRLGTNQQQTDATIQTTTNSRSTDARSTELASDTLDKDTLVVLDNLANALAKAGFTDTRVGAQNSNSFIMQVENTVFIHSELEAIETLADIARTILPRESKIQIDLLHGRLPKFTAAFSHDITGQPTVISSPPPAKAVSWNKPGPTTARSLAHVTVQPELRTAIGTEFGTIDYSAALRAGVTIPLWAGSHAMAAGIVPLLKSDNFDDGGVFSRDAYRSSLERIAISQYFPIGRALHSSVELGRFQIQNFFYDAVRVQAAWQARTAPWILQASAARFDLVSSTRQRGVFLGSVNYSLPRYSANLAATAGQFFFGDRGIRIDGTRRYGNTFVTAFLKFIDTDNIAGGLRFSAPFGPKRAMKWHVFSFSGTSRWSHALQTTIRFPDADDNRLQPGLLLEPLYKDQIGRSLFDQGRLTRTDVTHRFKFASH